MYGVRVHSPDILRLLRSARRHALLPGYLPVLSATPARYVIFTLSSWLAQHEGRAQVHASKDSMSRVYTLNLQQP